MWRSLAGDERVDAELFRDVHEAWVHPHLKAIPAQKQPRPVAEAQARREVKPCPAPRSFSACSSTGSSCP